MARVHFEAEKRQSEKEMGPAPEDASPICEDYFEDYC
jgi:hypothetical protein